MDKKVLLMILDGWGEGRQDESNVIYAQGAPYIEVLTAQQKLLQAELAEASDKFAQIQAIVNLYHALGGGY